MTDKTEPEKKKRGCCRGCVAGCLKGLIIGTVLVAGAYYFGKDSLSDIISKLPDPYERDAEEKKAAEGAIRSLFEGGEHRQKNF